MKTIGLNAAGTVVLPMMVLALAALIHCGSESTDVGGTGDDGGSETGTFSGGEGGGPTCKSVGSACVQGTECCVGSCTGTQCGGVVADGGTKACNGANAACAKGFDCCSGTCNGNLCVGSTLTGAGGDGGVGGPAATACTAPADSCTTSAQCCSGLCEPVTGQAGVIQCRDACRADGITCSDAQDCCSLSCTGGKCGGTICLVESESCTNNAECCSNLCDPDKHQCIIDAANSTCRPTGETCNSGPQRGCCGATPDNDLCDKVDFNPPRCIAPPSQCKGDKATCTDDAQCCSGTCDPTTKSCLTQCVPAAGACKTGGDCCTSSCTNGSCDAPLPPTPPGGTGGTSGTSGTVGTGGAGTTCLPVGNTCATAADCCTSLCLGGSCAIPAPR
jgi:hypothetical protein